MCKFFINPYVKDIPDWSCSDYSFLNTNDMLAFHQSIPDYHPTPLDKLPELATRLRIGQIFVKNESFRFGIKAFKALGASYAIFRFLKREYTAQYGDGLKIARLRDIENIIKVKNYTFSAATDGNHGKAVAWTARRLKQKAVIFMPHDSAKARIESIICEGAEVVLVKGSFDDCVQQCAQESQKKGWQVISDTAYQDYYLIPQFILLGYTTLFKEMENTINKLDSPDVDFVFLQAGVGGFAAAATSYYVKRYKQKRPKLVCVEPLESDCFFESICCGKGNPVATRGNLCSIMAGLNCGIPSPVAWPVVKDGVHFFLSISDSYAQQAMRLYAREKIVSGESGAAGLAGLLALCSDKKIKAVRHKIKLGIESRVLLINTEGDTDPTSYQQIIKSI